MLDGVAATEIETALAGMRDLTEPHVARILSQNLPSGAHQLQSSIELSHCHVSALPQVACHEGRPSGTLCVGGWTGCHALSAAGCTAAEAQSSERHAAGQLLHPDHVQETWPKKGVNKILNLNGSAGDGLYLGNSMPIRDMEMYAAATSAPTRVFPTSDPRPQLPLPAHGFGAVASGSNAFISIH